MARGPHGRITPPDEPERPARPGTFRRIIGTFRPYRRRVTLVAGLILLTSGLGLVNPLLIKVVFDDVFGGAGAAAHRLNVLYVAVGVMIAMPIVNGLLGLWQTYTNNRVGQ